MAYLRDNQSIAAVKRSMQTAQNKHTNVRTDLHFCGVLCHFDRSLQCSFTAVILHVRQKSTLSRNNSSQLMGTDRTKLCCSSQVWNLYRWNSRGATDIALHAVFCVKGVQQRSWWERLGGVLFFADAALPKGASVWIMIASGSLHFEREDKTVKNVNSEVFA